MSNAQPDPAQPPQEPILVIGKTGNAFYPVQTLEWAIKHVRDYLASDGMGDKDSEMIQTGRLTLEELDFFDGTGRHLKPVLDDSKELVNLISMSDEEWLREHIRYLLDATGKRIKDPQILDQLPKMPSDDVNFADFLAQIVNEPVLRFDPNQNCNWWARIWGTCR